MTTTTQIPTDPRPALHSAFDTVAAVIAQVRAEHLTRPTPCDGMDVGSLLEHLMVVAERVGCAARGEPPMGWPTTWPDLALEERVPAWRRSADASFAEWMSDDARLERPTMVPWGQFSGAETVAVYANEALVHAWDLAVAIGADVDWDVDAIAVASQEIHRQLPDAVRSPMWDALRSQMPEGVTLEVPFGDAVEVTGDPTPIERLVAWNGRSPDWSGVSR